MKHLEDEHQEAVFQWALYNEKKYPCLKWCFFSVPNGGKRNAREGARLKRQGVKSGVSDMTLQVARKGFNGLWIELKIKPNKLLKNQIEFIKFIKEEGYKAIVCYSAIEVIQEIELYLKK